MFGSSALTKTLRDIDPLKQWYEVTRTHWKGLDQEDNRCKDNTDSDGETSACIANYMEAEVGCSIPLFKNIESAKMCRQELL